MVDLSSLGKHVALVTWVRFPDNAHNLDFVANVKARGVTPDQKLLFLCRSGIRSRYTAAAITDAGFANCFNALQGFEGDKDEEGRRDTICGWKVAGLPWIQG